MGRLEHLEVENFKSYKGFQKIGPFHDFTAVIGPNGSGKSNLMDAISFVLGVKSSQLRSSQLKELVYDGPDSNATSCYVRAFYQSDDEETVFQRSVTDSGASEYAINDKTVSYTVYSQQLERFGILIKSRNFLVFQGDVEAIASQSPKDLTKMIELISGSLELKVEYDRLKLEQEKATEASALNFNKKRTMNAELKQFKEQKEETTRFHRMQRQRDQLVKTHFLWKAYHLEKQVEIKSQEIEQHKGESSQYDKAKAEYDAQMKAAKKQHAKANKQVLLLEQSLKGKEQEQDELKPSLVQIEEKIKHVSEKLRVAMDTKSQVGGSIERQMNDIRDLEQNLQAINIALEAVSMEMEETNEIQLSQAQKQELQGLNSQLDKATFSEKETLRSLKRQLGHVNDIVDRLQSTADAHQQHKRSLLQEQSTIETRKQRLEETMEETSNHLRKLQDEQRLQEAERKKTQQLELETNEKLEAVNQRLLQAKVDMQQSARARKSKEALDGMMRLFSGVYGRLVDLCKPSQRKYDHAVSVCLGKNMDAIVVDSEKTAIECIRYMREQRAGQATFLPLDTIQVKPVNEKYRTFVKGARLAVDVIQFEAIAERAVQYAVGNTIIADSMEISKHIVYDKRQEVKVVSLDGGVIHKTGMITGGVNESMNGAKRWEEKEIENLQQDKQKLQAVLSDLARQKRRSGMDDQLLGELTSYESKMAQLQDEMLEITQRLESIATELTHLETAIEKQLFDIAQAREPVPGLEGEIERVQAHIQQQQQALFADFCQKIGVASLEEYHSRTTAVTSAKSQKKLEYVTAKAKLENQLHFENKRHQETRQRVDRLQDRITQLEKSLEKANETKSELEQDFIGLDHEADSIREQLKEAKEQLKVEEQRVQATKKENQDFLGTFDALIKSIAQKESEIERAMADKLAILRKCKLEEIQLPLADGRSLADVPLNELREESEESMQLDPPALDYDQLKPEHLENSLPEQDQEFEQKIKELTLEIEKLAPNVRAANNFNEAEKKLKDSAHEFDKSRAQAKEAREAFLEIKRERHQRFMRTYTEIADNIDRIYKELTQSETFPLGGTAYLSLEDSEEPYLDGVKYHAMPPMKRFREMELLSGGEKTMAAMALLFAVQQAQPAPFFLLDEIDAALDNANVSRMRSYIARHCDSVQFIVISLKSSFYEHAQSLVGVYKDQHEHSSKILTLDLTKFNE
ncbi:RecF/RecN/SMC [Gorgonomyces haynaldii]|nr:RecF/RecN/SMC [Gorgonomyces haynaldii]